MSTPVAASPLKRTLKFIDSDGDGLPLKRRQAQQACGSCRKKKKRCPHNSAATDPIPTSVIKTGKTPNSTSTHGSPPNQPNPSNPKGQTPSPVLPEQSDESSSTHLVASQLVELSASRFVGDLDPESIFIEAAHKRSEQSSSYRHHCDVGTWMRRLPRQPNKIDAPRANNGSERANINSHHRRQPSNDSLPFFVLKGGPTHSAQDGTGAEFDVCPPEQDYQYLHTIYSEQIHPILPFLDDADFHESRSPYKESARKSVFRQVISLAAAVDASAAKHLRLQVNGPLLSFQDFHQRLSKAIFSSLDDNILTDRADRIRVLLILSFFYQPRNPSERDMAPLIFSQAVHFSQSLGVHLRGYKDERMSGEGAAERLFCMIWALDRINAAFHGRPCLIHDRDTDRDLDQCIDAQDDPAFRLFLRTVKILDNVIWLYCPRNDNTGPVDIPVFESMIVDVGAEKLHPRLLITIEVFYHAISVLSCRQAIGDFNPAATGLAHLPQPNLNARRSLSADRIVEIVESSLSASESLCNLPFVPYAVALSLSVAYRKMRYSRIPMYRMRGKSVFKEVVDLLEKLGEIYTSARVNASLGTSILRELQKTVNEFAGSSTPPPRETMQRSRVDSPAQTPEVSMAVTEHYRLPNHLDNHPSRAEGQAPHEATIIPGAYDSPITAPLLVANESSTNHHRAAMGNLAEPLAWNQMDDIDLFGHFDPSYDLGAVETALEANLDMRFPQAWTMQWPE